MPKFFVDSGCISGGRASITGDNARHISIVLRKKPGDELLLCDENGTDYLCRVLKTDGGVLCEVMASFESGAEPDIDAGVFLAFTKGDRMEMAIQKCVELGAAAIYPFACSRCVARYDAGTLVKKTARWQKIADEAAKQSMRARTPLVEPIVSFGEMLRKASEYSVRVILYEMETHTPLRKALSGAAGSVALITGPEGGFEQSEIDEARAASVLPVTIGRRILRAETAPVCALSALMYETGNLGG